MLRRYWDSRQQESPGVLFLTNLQENPIITLDISSAFVQFWNLKTAENRLLGLEKQAKVGHLCILSNVAGWKRASVVKLRATLRSRFLCEMQCS